VRKIAGVLALAVLLGSAAAGWYFLADRGDSTVDSGGFDVSATSKPRAIAPTAASVSEPAPAASGLSMVKGAAESFGAVPPPAPAAASAAPAAPDAPARSLPEARREFIAQARKHEADVIAFAGRLTAQSPVIRRYGYDWMQHPDLRKLNDDYMRNHDPIAFILGLSKAPSFGAMVKRYAGAPEIRAAVVLGMTKEVPTELIQSGLDVLRQDPAIKGVVAGVAPGLGLPPGMTAVLSSADAAKLDKAKAAAELKALPVPSDGAR
jgi:hypothetical protein